MQSSFTIDRVKLADDGRLSIRIIIGGRSNTFYPTLDRFAEVLESSVGTIGDPLTWFLQLDEMVLEEYAHIYVANLEGMDSKKAYEKGYCSHGHDAASTTPDTRVEGDAPEDEYEDVATRLPSAGRSQRVVNVRGDYSPFQIAR